MSIPSRSPSRTLLRALAMIPLTLLAASCATTAGLETSAACLAFRPILPSRADVMTDETKRQILAHDETGAKLCGWKTKPKR